MNNIKLKIKSFTSVLTLCDSLKNLANSSIMKQQKVYNNLKYKKEFLERFIKLENIKFKKPIKRLFMFSNMGFCAGYNNDLKKIMKENDWKIGKRAPSMGKEAFMFSNNFNEFGIENTEIFINENRSIKSYSMYYEPIQKNDISIYSEICKKNLIQTYKKIFKDFCLATLDYFQTLARLQSMTNAKNKTEDILKDLVLQSNRMRQEQITEEIAIIIGGKNENE